MSRWWRAYDEAVDDPKLIALSDRQFRAWFNLCCVTSQNGGVLPKIAVVAIKLRVKPDRARAMVAELAALGLVDIDTFNVATMHNWNGRQYKSDVTDPTNAERQKRYRGRHRNGQDAVTDTVTVTPPREQITEADSEDSTSLRSVVRARPKPKRERAKARTPLPEDWQPDEQDVGYAQGLRFNLDQIRAMSTAFFNHHRGKGNLMADWHAAWRTWCGNEIKFQRPAAGAAGNGRRTVQDAAKDLHENILARVAAFDEPAPSGLFEREGEDAVRLLPPGGRE